MSGAPTCQWGGSSRTNAHSPEGLGHVLFVLRQQWQTLVEQLPVKGPTSPFVLRPVCKGLKINDVNEGTDTRTVVLCDGLCGKMRQGAVLFLNKSPPQFACL